MVVSTVFEVLQCASTRATKVPSLSPARECAELTLGPTALDTVRIQVFGMESAAHACDDFRT